MINDLWYKNAVIYCLSVGTYMDANGDGIGDFRGLMRRLDYLHGLGVTAIWLMPFQTSPCRDDGYDVADYYNVDPRYGTLGDFVEFTHGAKQRGIRVLIDLVVNHTSDQHPWFKQARSRSKFEISRLVCLVEEETAARKQRHGISRRAKIDLDLRSRSQSLVLPSILRFPARPEHLKSEVQAEILKIMGFWIQPGVSGFRMDAVPFIISTKGTERAKTKGAVRYAARVSRIPAMAAGRLHRSRGSECAARNRHGLLRRRRRAHAHDVQLSGEPAPVLCIGCGRYPTAR